MSDFGRPIALSTSELSFLRASDTAFQSAASVQGRAMEDTTATLLKMHGWTIQAMHIKVEGQEIDIAATHPNGVDWWIECKGSWAGTRPGGKRTDTIKKAVAVGWFLTTVASPRPYMLVLSHKPPPNSSGGIMLQRAIDHCIFTNVYTLTDLAVES